ncbi:MAG: hypothetical protein HYZ54_14340 [Ignavibacteriae bacterium]|nr:hypothetical protein [Ignavibacteriota bacterium]
MTVRIFQNRNLFNWLVGIVLTIGALASFGCNDKLSVVGNNLISDTLQLTSVSSTDSVPFVIGTSSYINRISLSGIGYVFIGKSGTTEAFSLSRLSVPDSAPELTIDNFVSAKMLITPSTPYYAYGDTIGNQLSFTVYKVVKVWTTIATPDTITPDFIDKTKTLATYSGIIPLKDSSSVISFDFDRDQVIEWFNLRKQYGNANDTLNYGIAFIPNSNSNIIRRFASGAVGSSDSTRFATILITYHRPNATDSTIKLFSAYDGTYLTTTAPEDKYITIQGASAINSNISFDVSSIPKGVAIHLAGLTLTMDPSKSFAGTAGTDPVVFATFVDSTSNNLVRPYYGSRLKDGNGNYTNEYFFPTLNTALEGMIRRNGKGTITLQVQNSYYQNRMDKLVFFGSDAVDSTKRPKLSIVYSSRPKF